MRWLYLFLLSSCGLAQIHVSACTAADAGFTGGSCYTSPIALPPGAPAYLQQERYGNFSYRFPVADGTYKITLHMIENSTAITGPGQRVFSVSINGSTIITALDLAGGAPLNTPVDSSFPVSVSGGVGITIVFTTAIRNAVVSAIDITPAPVPLFPGCASDGAGGIACTGGFSAGADGKFDPTITWGGVTYRLPSGDGTGKALADQGAGPCGNVDPAVVAKFPTCHQLIWR